MLASVSDHFIVFSPEFDLNQPILARPRESRWDLVLETILLEKTRGAGQRKNHPRHQPGSGLGIASFDKKWVQLNLLKPKA